MRPRRRHSAAPAEFPSEGVPASDARQTDRGRDGMNGNEARTEGPKHTERYGSLARRAGLKSEEAVERVVNSGGGVRSAPHELTKCRCTLVSALDCV